MYYVELCITTRALSISQNLIAVYYASMQSQVDFKNNVSFRLTEGGINTRQIHLGTIFDSSVKPKDYLKNKKKTWLLLQESPSTI